jgi:hypothetical protein
LPIVTGGNFRLFCDADADAAPARSSACGRPQNARHSSRCKPDNAAYDFSATQGTRQWREQYDNPGGGWRDLTHYDGVEQRWDGNGSVSRFALSPTSSPLHPIARARVAPSSGTIAIRGYVLKEAAGGAGVTARITDNGRQIWPASGGAQALGGADAKGYDTNVTMAVTAGGTIRFEVRADGHGNADSDATAWAPTIAYQ